MNTITRSKDITYITLNSAWQQMLSTKNGQQNHAVKLCSDMKGENQLDATQWFIELKECHPRCVYQNYIRSMIKEYQSKTQLYLYVQ